MITPTEAELLTVHSFAKEAYRGRNRGQALVDTLKKAVDVCRGTAYPAERCFEILLKVMIGETLTDRGKGRWFVGPKLGAEGFQKDLRDKSDQSAHAVAAMYIGFNPRYPYGTEQIVALLTEFGLLTGTDPEWQDTRLYAIAGALGRRVTNENLPELPARVAETICDKSVTVPT